jgi:hypothetical protein
MGAMGGGITSDQASSGILNSAFDFLGSDAFSQALRIT